MRRLHINSCLSVCQQDIVIVGCKSLSILDVICQPVEKEFTPEDNDVCLVCVWRKRGIDHIKYWYLIIYGCLPLITVSTA